MLDSDKKELITRFQTNKRLENYKAEISDARTPTVYLHSKDGLFDLTR